MNENVQLHETKALGWYAIQRARLADWLRPARHRSQAPLGSASYSGAELNSIQDKAKPDENQADKLKEVVHESQNILAEADTVFPFTLFPDTITIDRHKLTIVHRAFVKVAQTVSVPIENIKNIEADIGPFFGSLIVTSDHFVNNIQHVNYLRRHDAMDIQKLVQGTIVAVREQIDLSNIDTAHLKKMLMDLGEGHGRAS